MVVKPIFVIPAKPNLNWKEELLVEPGNSKLSSKWILNYMKNSFNDNMDYVLSVVTQLNRLYTWIMTMRLEFCEDCSVVPATQV